ncbi:MAG TPA: MarR family transcriptional regulator [Microscillaceae bacterium]|nr:MarR family transcriptional regulator [Microscillaceae bacterium]
MGFDTPTQTVLYSIEQAIKEYRKFCQKNISEVISDITVDQGLVLIIIDKNPKMTQKEMAELVFKDYASMTRMIDLMVKKGYLKRLINEEDRRRFLLEITTKGKEALEKLQPTIEYNRNTALKGLSATEILQLYNSLQKIITNCQES